MKTPLIIKNTNTILYCQKWRETVAFYQYDLELPITFALDWFVEFQVSGPAHLSVADERRATIKSGQENGLTITLQVDNAEETWHYLQRKGLILTPLKTHTWGAHVFYFFDPEGHRLEIWSLA